MGVFRPTRRNPGPTFTPTIAPKPRTPADSSVRVAPPTNLSKEEAGYLKTANERAKGSFSRIISGGESTGDLGAVDTATRAIERTRRANRLNSTGSKTSPTTWSDR